MAWVATLIRLGGEDLFNLAKTVKAPGFFGGIGNRAKTAAG
jgi:hypothetical protein